MRVAGATTMNDAETNFRKDGAGKIHDVLAVPETGIAEVYLEAGVIVPDIVVAIGEHILSPSTLRLVARRSHAASRIAVRTDMVLAIDLDHLVIMIARRGDERCIERQRRLGLIRMKIGLHLIARRAAEVGIRLRYVLVCRRIEAKAFRIGIGTRPIDELEHV